LGKDLSLEDRRELNTFEKKNLIYGEMYFQELAEIFAYVESNCGGMPSGGAFYDLGSGLGKVALAAALLHRFTRCVGIEILPKLADAAAQL
jgi:hypothetical protein